MLPVGYSDCVCDPQPHSKSSTLLIVLPRMLPSFPINVTVRGIGEGEGSVELKITSMQFGQHFCSLLSVKCYNS